MVKVGLFHALYILNGICEKGHKLLFKKGYSNCKLKGFPVNFSKEEAIHGSTEGEVNLRSGTSG
jgi:hypothetical protein